MRVVHVEKHLPGVNLAGSLAKPLRVTYFAASGCEIRNNGDGKRMLNTPNGRSQAITFQNASVRTPSISKTCLAMKTSTPLTTPIVAMRLAILHGGELPLPLELESASRTHTWNSLLCGQAPPGVHRTAGQVSTENE